MITLTTYPYPDRFGIEAESTDTPRLKLVPGARYRAEEGWSVPTTPATIYVLYSLFRPEEIRVLPTAQEELDEVYARHQMLMAIRHGRHHDPDLPEHLYDFQCSGATFLQHQPRALLADEMGCGKTIQILAVLQTPALIVCPNTVKGNWAREIERFRPDLQPVVIEGTATKRRKLIAQALDIGDGVVVIINYESLKLHTCWASPTNVAVPPNRKNPGELNEFDWRTVVLDEAHRVKDPKAQQTLACHGVAAGVTRRYALTGTPIANHEGELWPLLKWTDPEQYPDKKRFHNRYLIEEPGFFGGMEVHGLNPATEAEFHAVLDGTMLRRTKAQVLPQLPEKQHVTYSTELKPTQQKAYTTFEDDLILRLETGLIAGRSLGEELARLRQLACGTPIVDPEEGTVVGLDLPSSKVDALHEILESIGDDPLVVYAEHSKLIHLLVADLRKHNISAGYITGEVPSAERNQVLAAFADGKIRVLLATAGAAAEGINLTTSSRLVFAQLPWSQVHYLQAQDRIHRPGAERHEHLEIISLITPNTIEEKVQFALNSKAVRLESVTKDTQRLLDFLRGEKVDA